MPVVTQGYFSICLPDSEGNPDEGTEIVLTPGPTYVEYGERVIYTLQETEGRTIKQRSTRNPKVKSWVWEGYNNSIPYYLDLYETLFSLQEHVLVAAEKPPYVFVFENITGELEAWDTDTSEFVEGFRRARILMVDRELEKRGGRASYKSTTMQFTIDEEDQVVF